MVKLISARQRSMQSGDFFTKIENGVLSIEIDKSIYSLEVVLLSSKRYLDCVYIFAKDSNNDQITITLKAKRSDLDLNTLALDFLNTLIEQQNRINLENRFGQLRKKIVEAAFSPLMKGKSS